MNQPTLQQRIAETMRPPQRVVMRQQWRSLLFLHWPFPAEQIEPLLPAGLQVDTFDGQAWVGLVPFLMQKVHPVWAPPLPWLSCFAETNVRTYVHCNSKPGVWFFSLDAAQPIAVAIARTIWRLPYFAARMSVHQHEARTSYCSRRAAGAFCQAEAEACSAPMQAAPGSLEFFLAERYLLYACKQGILYRGSVHHTPYPLQKARVKLLKENLLETAGLRRPSAEPLAHYAAGVDVEVFPLNRVHRQ